MVLNGVKYHCPKNKEELTTATYQRIFTEWWSTEEEKKPTERDYVKLFCIITGAKFRSHNLDKDSLLAIWCAIRWVLAIDFSKEPNPTELLGKELKDIKALSIGQNIMIRQRLEAAKFQEECFAIACAVYLTNPFEEDKAVELEKEILALPAYKVYPVGFFLCHHAWKYGQSSQSAWLLPLDSLRQNLKRMFPSWPNLRSLNLTQTF
jgi:hypothetical protein